MESHREARARRLALDVVMWAPARGARRLAHGPRPQPRLRDARAGERPRRLDPALSTPQGRDDGAGEAAHRRQGAHGPDFQGGTDRLWTGVVKRVGLKVRFGERLEGLEPDGGGGFVVTSTRQDLPRPAAVAPGARAARYAAKAGRGRRGAGEGGLPPAGPDQYAGMPVLVVGAGTRPGGLARAGRGAGDGRAASLSRRRVRPREANNRSRIEEAAAQGSCGVLLESSVTAIEPRPRCSGIGTATFGIANEAVVVVRRRRTADALLRDRHHGRDPPRPQGRRADLAVDLDGPRAEHALRDGPLHVHLEAVAIAGAAVAVAAAVASTSWPPP